MTGGEGGAFDTSMWDNCPARRQVALRHTGTTPRSQDWALSRDHSRSQSLGSPSIIVITRPLLGDFHTPVIVSGRRVVRSNLVTSNSRRQFCEFSPVLSDFYFSLEESCECSVTLLGAVIKINDPYIFRLLLGLSTHSIPSRRQGLEQILFIWIFEFLSFIVIQKQNNYNGI